MDRGNAGSSPASRTYGFLAATWTELSAIHHLLGLPSNLNEDDLDWLETWMNFTAEEEDVYHPATPETVLAWIHQKLL